LPEAVLCTDAFIFSTCTVKTEALSGDNPIT